MKSAIEVHEENIKILESYDGSGVPEKIKRLAIKYITFHQKVINDMINEYPKKYQDKDRLKGLETIVFYPASPFLKENFISELKDVTGNELVEILSPIAKEKNYKLETSREIFWAGKSMWYQPDISDGGGLFDIRFVPRLGLKYKLKKKFGKQHDA